MRRTFFLILIFTVRLIGGGPEEVDSKTMKDDPKTRKAAVAGFFYPADSEDLRAQVTEYMARVHGVEVKGRPVALVCPHAGYVYSGSVAAYGYKLLENRNVRTIVVISPCHVDHFPFSAVYDGDYYETPLGDIPVDDEARKRLARAGSDLVRLSDRGHREGAGGRAEHALEVQLPFLQVVLGDFALVPVVMGDQSWEMCEALGEAVAPLLERPDVVVVASSDLSHFYPDRVARRLDGAFVKTLEKMDPRALYEGIRGGTFEACGGGPIISAMIAARKAGATECTILRTANSGDATGERDRVVGYAAAAMVVPISEDAGIEDRESDEESLTREEKKHLIDMARGSIAEQLGLGQVPPHLESEHLREKRGAFVTIKIDGNLRGCIGYIEPIKPLETAVEEMAKAAAFDDPRFPPLTEEEFPKIEIEISALTPLRPVKEPEDIVVGKHGLVIEKGMHRGLLLPQVATEYGWDRWEFLKHTCRKAMLPDDAWKEQDARLYVFSAEVFGERDLGEDR